jgi:hypothetical protein
MRAVLIFVLARVMRRARRIIRLVDGHVERDAEKVAGELPPWVIEPVGA